MPSLLAGQLPYLILTLPEQLLLAQIVDTQQLPHTNQHPPLEGGNSRRDLLHRRLDAKEEKALRSSVWAPPEPPTGLASVVRWACMLLKRLPGRLSNSAASLRMSGRGEKPQSGSSSSQTLKRRKCCLPNRNHHLPATGQTAAAKAAGASASHPDKRLQSKACNQAPVLLFLNCFWKQVPKERQPACSGAEVSNFGNF